MCIAHVQNVHMEETNQNDQEPFPEFALSVKYNRLKIIS